MKKCCQPDAEGKCTQCGEPVPAKTYWPCYKVVPREKRPIVFARCKHLGDKSGQQLIRCPSCRGNVRQKFDVHLCAVWGECLPHYAGKDSISHACIGCDRREPQLNSAGPAN